jgi:hypothetical protein
MLTFEVLRGLLYNFLLCNTYSFHSKRIWHQGFQYVGGNISKEATPLEASPKALLLQAYGLECG